MVWKVSEYVMEALLEEVCNKEKKFIEILKQLNNIYNSIAVKNRGKEVE